MKVFITWSGERSRAVADVISKWLPGVLQAVKPYFSPDDVAKGSRWFPEIANELNESNVGLLCMTRDNLTEPWLLFEAGALGKNLDKSKVCPLLFGVEPTDITGPLAQFQSARFNKTEFKKVVEMINSELKDNALETTILDNVFNRWWPELEEAISKVSSKPGNTEERETRSDRDILEEILQLNRAISRDGRSSRKMGISPTAIEDLVSTYTNLIKVCLDYPPSKTILQMLIALRTPIEHIISVTWDRAKRLAHTLEIDELLSRLDVQPSVFDDDLEGLLDSR